MLEIATRRRPFFLLVIVISAQLVLLAFQIRRQRDIRLIRMWTVETITPFERGGSWVVRVFGGGWRNYVNLRHAREENERLQSRVEELEMSNRALESRAAEAERLASLLNFRETHAEVPMLAAQVIGSGTEASSHTVIINRGERDRLRKNMPVITPDGVVGKIVEVYPSASQVLLITDKDSGLGALLGNSRTHGIVKGTGDSFVRLDYLVNDEKVNTGDVVVTSGEDRIFPKDLPVGTVVDAKPAIPFQVIHVRPVARLDRLEEVLILLSQQEIIFKKETASSAVPEQTPQPTGTAATETPTPPTPTATPKLAVPVPTPAPPKPRKIARPAITPAPSPLVKPPAAATPAPTPAATAPPPAAPEAAPAAAPAPAEQPAAAAPAPTPTPAQNPQNN